MAWFSARFLETSGFNMNLKVAESLDEVIESWRLVYHQYVAAMLIDVNPFSIFTFPEYISRNAAVILGKLGEKSICTISAVLDSKKGLPLDSYFKEELDQLRKQDRKLIEIGLLASSRETVNRAQTIELLSGIARFGVHCHYHDYVIGVHPRRAEFFKKVFGFHVIGESKVYHRLRKAEVVLLYADGQHFETLARAASHDVYYSPTELKFERRFQFGKLSLLKASEAGDYFVSFVKKLKKQFLSPGKLKINEGSIQAVPSTFGLRSMD